MHQQISTLNKVTILHVKIVKVIAIVAVKCKHTKVLSLFLQFSYHYTNPNNFTDAVS